MTLTLPDPDVRGLASGEMIVAFVPRGSVSEGDEIELEASGPRRPEELKPAYQRWAAIGPPPGTWWAIVESVDPAQSLDVADGASRHILTSPGEGDLVVLRVTGSEGPVLSEEAFAARRAAVEQAMRA